jgi:hypothetical protein
MSDEVYIRVVLDVARGNLYALAKKKSRTADDLPFTKLSNRALNKVKRRWKQMACRKI